MEHSPRKFSLGYHQNRLIVVIFFLLIIFSIWFGILLQKSKKDLTGIAGQARYQNMMVRKAINTGNQSTGNALPTGALMTTGK